MNSRKKLTHVREQWPDVDPYNPEIGAAILGAMGHLLGYPWNQNVKWEDQISVPLENIKATLNRMLKLGL